jgi:hypothetical protein
MYLNILKARYDEPISNTILNGEKLLTSPVKSAKGKGCQLAPLLLNIVLEFIARERGVEKEIKGIQIGKEDVKLLLFTDDMLIYIYT